MENYLNIKRAEKQLVDNCVAYITEIVGSNDNNVKFNGTSNEFKAKEYGKLQRIFLNERENKYYAQFEFALVEIGKLDLTDLVGLCRFVENYANLDLLKKQSRPTDENVADFIELNKLFVNCEGDFDRMEALDSNFKVCDAVEDWVKGEYKSVLAYFDLVEDETDTWKMSYSFSGWQKFTDDKLYDVENSGEEMVYEGDNMDKFLPKGTELTMVIHKGLIASEVPTKENLNDYKECYQSFMDCEGNIGKMLMSSAPLLVLEQNGDQIKAKYKSIYVYFNSVGGKWDLSANIDNKHKIDINMLDYYNEDELFSTKHSETTSAKSEEREQLHPTSQNIADYYEFMEKFENCGKDITKFDYETFDDQVRIGIEFETIELFYNLKTKEFEPNVRCYAYDEGCGLYNEIGLCELSTYGNNAETFKKANVEYSLVQLKKALKCLCDDEKVAELTSGIESYLNNL